MKTEQGSPISFRDHLFLFDIYRDMSPKLAVLKAAQIGLSTLEILKSFWVAKNLGLDIIYTLPTEDDRNEFVSGKVNRIIAQNPVLQDYVKDKDSVEQKRVGSHLIYYRGTWTKKAAIMVSSDLNIYDEVDASKPDVIEQYATRLQASSRRWEWYFSHPSSEGTGVDVFWQRSDQKHWFIRCSNGHLQYLSWPESIDTVRGIYQCKTCKIEITDQQRRQGQWVKKYKDREFSGYWIPLLINTRFTAKDIIKYHDDKSEEYFYNKVLGLPYVGGGNKLTKANLMKNLNPDVPSPDKNDRIVLGVDTGAHVHTIIGTEYGLLGYDESSNYEEVEKFLQQYPRAIVVIDQGGDLTRPRELREKYPGRVFLCSYKEAEGKTLQLVKWGENDEAGAVQADRNRLIQLVVDEFTDNRIPLAGKEETQWYDYWLHWNNLTRVNETNDKTGFIRKVWRRNGADHWAHATVYCRIGLSRFAAQGTIIGAKNPIAGIPEAPNISPSGFMSIDTNKLIAKKKHDWRIG